ncbi:MAG: hypothetical protein V9E86_10090 [Nitrosomonas sp.]
MTTTIMHGNHTFAISFQYIPSLYRVALLGAIFIRQKSMPIYIYPNTNTLDV